LKKKILNIQNDNNVLLKNNNELMYNIKNTNVIVEKILDENNTLKNSIQKLEMYIILNEKEKDKEREIKNTKKEEKKLKKVKKEEEETQKKLLREREMERFRNEKKRKEKS